MMTITTSPSSSRVLIEGILFDYDGTLVQTRFIDEQAVAELVRRDPAAAEGARIFWETDGQPIVTRLELAWPGRLDEVLPLFDVEIPPRVFPGIHDVLRTLRSAGYRLGVVSSRQRKTLEWGLQASGLRPFFSTVIGLEDVQAPKPHPEGLQLAMRHLRVMRSRTVYIGDSEVDVEAGRQAEVMAWRALWGAHDSSESPDADAPVLRRPADILERLGSTT